MNSPQLRSPVFRVLSGATDDQGSAAVRRNRAYCHYKDVWNNSSNHSKYISYNASHSNGTLGHLPVEECNFLELYQVVLICVGIGLVLLLVLYCAFCAPAHQDARKKVAIACRIACHQPQLTSCEELVEAGLKQYSRGWNCDYCWTRYRTDKDVFRCQSCDTDFCESCIQSNRNSAYSVQPLLETVEAGAAGGYDQLASQEAEANNNDKNAELVGHRDVETDRELEGEEKVP